MEFQRIKYPNEEFYRFGESENAVCVPNDVIEQWINEGIESVKQQLINGVESPYSMHASGDTIVIVFFSQDCEEDVFDDVNYFEVIVAKDYEEGSFFIENIKNQEDGNFICTNMTCPFKEICARSVLNTPSNLENVTLKRVFITSQNGMCPSFMQKGAF